MPEIVNEFTFIEIGVIHHCLEANSSFLHDGFFH